MPDHIQLPLFGNIFPSNDIPARPGIYIIRNLANNNFYIGSTVNLKKRWKQHEWSLTNNRHHNPHLQAAWNLYGFGSFRYEILESVSDADQLIQTEQKWIDAFDAAQRRDCYNVLPVAGTTAGRIVRDETRRKMSASQTGKKTSDEAKAKQRAAKLGAKQSLAQRQAQSKRQTGKSIKRPKGLYRYSQRKLNPEEVIELKAYREQGWSLFQLSLMFGLSIKNIWEILKGIRYQDEHNHTSDAT